MRRAIAALGPEMALVSVVLLWASTFVLTKGIFAEMAPLAFTFVRFLLILLLALAVLGVRAQRERSLASWRVRRADLPRFVAAGLCGYTLYQLGFVLGLDRTSAFSSSLLIALVPLFTVVILALLGERTPLRAWLGLGVALAGVLIFLSDKLDAAGTLLGDALSLAAAVSFAVYGVINRPLVRTYAAETYTAYTLAAGTLPLLVVGAPAALAQDWSAVSGHAWLILAYLVMLPVYVAYMLWNWAIKQRGIATASSVTLLVPVVSGVLSAWLFGEAFGPAKLLGAALVLAGLVAPYLPLHR